MRTYSKMDKNRQYRLREYIRANMLIPSKTLAEDVRLRKTTVMAIKANITRNKY